MQEFLTDNDLPQNFHGVWISKLLWGDKRLNWIEKCMMAELHWLYEESIGKGKEGCWPSNRYLSTMFDVKEQSISRIIAKLIELEYLTLVSFNGRYRILKSNIVTTLDAKGRKSQELE